ncbi:MAG TPA: hypothetical protein VFW96_05120 [Thermomicrobiales bacterium]|nr:hypothetical protein [Thermomicrobiales bacterium]
MMSPAPWSLQPRWPARPSGLSRAEREMIGVVVSAENRCIF